MSPPPIWKANGVEHVPAPPRVDMRFGEVECCAIVVPVNSPEWVRAVAFTTMRGMIGNHPLVDALGIPTLPRWAPTPRSLLLGPGPQYCNWEWSGPLWLARRHVEGSRLSEVFRHRVMDLLFSHPVENLPDVPVRFLALEDTEEVRRSAELACPLQRGEKRAREPSPPPVVRPLQDIRRQKGGRMVVTFPDGREIVRGRGQQRYLEFDEEAGPVLPEPVVPRQEPLKAPPAPSGQPLPLFVPVPPLPPQGNVGPAPAAQPPAKKGGPPGGSAPQERGARTQIRRSEIPAGVTTVPECEWPQFPLAAEHGKMEMFRAASPEAARALWNRRIHGGKALTPRDHLHFWQRKIPDLYVHRREYRLIGWVLETGRPPGTTQHCVAWTRPAVATGGLIAYERAKDPEFVYRMECRPLLDPDSPGCFPWDVTIQEDDLDEMWAEQVAAVREERTWAMRLQLADKWDYTSITPELRHQTLHLLSVKLCALPTIPWNFLAKLEERFDEWPLPPP